jgi:hypothetical protein
MLEGDSIFKLAARGYIDEKTYNSADIAVKY